LLSNYFYFWKYKTTVHKTVKVKYFLFTLLIFIASVSSSAQSSFNLLIQNEEDQFPTGLIEDNNGSIICSIFDEPDAHLIKINLFGEIIDTINFAAPINGDCNISEFIKYESNHFIAFGEYNTDTAFYLWYLELDFNLNIFKNIKIPVPSKIMSNYLNCIKNSKGNYIVGSSYGQEINNRDIFLFELDTNGTIIKENFWGANSSGVKLIYDLTEDKNKNMYYLMTNSSNLGSKGTCAFSAIDTSFIIIYQQSLGYDIGNLNEIELINDSIFILTGPKTFSQFDDEIQLGLTKFDLQFTRIDSIHFGKWGNDTVDYPAFHNNLSFITKENIFYGGTSNLDLFNPFFTTMPSWFLLVNFSDSFEVHWQNYYGGDAAYNLLSILATNDGGCVMAGTRYDYQTQNQERDVYILKVNEDGILTWTYNFPETTKQLIVYPNPGRDEISIKTFSDNLIFDLFDIKGNKILSQPIEKEDNINTSHLEKGVYTYRILNQKSETIETGKWIKD
jgi:hypothetical protein